MVASPTRQESQDFGLHNYMYALVLTACSLCLYIDSIATFTVENGRLCDLAKLLVANPVLKEKICTKQPLRVCQNVSFIVDLHSLDDPHDIRADENGVWKRKGSPVAYVSIHTQKSGEKKVFKRSRICDHPHHYKLTRTYYRHTSSPDFTRIITTVHGERCFCDPCG